MSGALSLAAARWSNAGLVARLAGQYPRLSQALAVRRAVETVYTCWPSLWSVRPLGRPVEIVVAVSSACQLQCRMCGIRQVMKQPPYAGQMLRHADLAPAFAEIEHWWPRPYVKFTGGEPLLLGDELFAILADCRRRGIATRLSTNGVMLARPEVAAELVRVGVDVVTVSLDGPREVHNAIRGRDFAFDRAVEGLRRLGELKASARGRGPLLQVSSVVSAANAHTLRDLYRLCTELPVQWWNIQLLNFLSRDASEAADHTARTWGYDPGPWRFFVNDELRRVDAELLAREAGWVRSRRAPFAISLHHIGGFQPARLREYYATSLAPLRDKICTVPFFSMHIVPNGDLVFCIDYPYVTYGNVRGQSLRASWQSAMANNYRRHLLSRFRDQGANPPHCQRCNWMFN